MNQEEMESERELKQKLKLLRKANTDPMLKADIEEIEEDFRFSDKEVI